MTNLVLNLTKAGEVAPKLQLNLKKNESFTIKLGWAGKTDLDLHAFVCENTGSGAKVSALEDILSTYNVIRKISGQEVGTLPKNSDGTFQIRNGALKHSPDATDGDVIADDDEWIIVDPSKLNPPANGAIEIPIVAMIHPQSAGLKFRDVQNATVTILNSDNQVLMSATLSSQFGEFVGVQMGSIIIEPNGVSTFAQVGVGFNCDFNSVIGNFA
ncbi:MAG TPA: TerD family protein [Methanosarcina sp.]|nr:TerD family protein [Methanosarcina sp.]